MDQVAVYFSHLFFRLGIGGLGGGGGGSNGAPRQDSTDAAAPDMYMCPMYMSLHLYIVEMPI